jgi:hypothetical protein
MSAKSGRAPFSPHISPEGAPLSHDTRYGQASHGTYINHLDRRTYIRRCCQTMGVDYCKMAKEYRVFLSCVSSEFEGARARVKEDLETRGLTVLSQATFRREKGTANLLSQLHDCIRGCNAVVCFRGARSGEWPSATAAAPFADMLPEGMTRASYTQWEFFFARHYEREIFTFRSNGDYRPDRPDGPNSPDIPGLQRQFLDHLGEEASDLTPRFGSVSDLRIEVLKLDWLNLVDSASTGKIVRLLVFPLLFLFANLVSHFTGGYTVLDLARPDVWLMMTARPGMAYLITENSGNTLLLLKKNPGPDARMTLDVPKAFDSGANGCMSDPPVGAIGFDEVPRPCQYDAPRQHYQITADSKEMKSGEAFWMFRLHKDGNNSKIGAATQQDDKLVPEWFIKYRDEEPWGPCIAMTAVSNCFDLSRSLDKDSHRLITWGATPEEKKMYYGQLDLNSHYEDASDKIHMIELLMTFLFSTFITIIADDLFRHRSRPSPAT